MSTRRLAGIVLASWLAGCGPSLGDAYERSFAAGQRAYHAGRYEEAAKSYEEAARAAERVKDRDEALFLVARMHERRGAHAEAKATLRPSGDSARSENPVVRDKCSTTGPIDAPRRRIATSVARPDAVSSDQMPKFRSKTIVRPSREMSGHRTRPALNCVTCRGCPFSGFTQMFSAPLRSDM